MPIVKTFPINDVGLAEMLPNMEDFTSNIGGLYTSDFLPLESL
jgi:hypothetical protein